MGDKVRNNPCAVGLRSQADKKVAVIVVEGTQNAPRLVHRQILEAPAGADMPEALASLRRQLLDLLKSHNVQRVGVRVAESNAKGANKEGARNRTRIDGVLLEVAGTQRLEVVHGALSTIGKELGAKDAKAQLEEDEFRGLALADLKLELREAVLVGVAALPQVDA
jgi:hypothetical protein